MSSFLLVIILLRVISGMLELSGAFFIYKLNSLEHALKINAFLASVGPFIFLAAMSVGLAGMQKIAYGRLALICAGVALIFLGLRYP